VSRGATVVALPGGKTWRPCGATDFFWCSITCDAAPQKEYLWSAYKAAFWSCLLPPSQDTRHKSAMPTMQDMNEKNWQAAKQRSVVHGAVNFEELCMADIRRVDGTARYSVMRHTSDGGICRIECVGWIYGLTTVFCEALELLLQACVSGGCPRRRSEGSPSWYCRTCNSTGQDRWLRQTGTYVNRTERKSDLKTDGQERSSARNLI
jgi:hypothetical protein